MSTGFFAELSSNNPFGPEAGFEAAPKSSVLLIPQLLGAAIPLILSLYWVAFEMAPDTVGAILRVVIFGLAFLLAAFWYRAPLTHAELMLFRVLSLSALAWFLTALAAVDRTHALAGWLKFVVLFAVCCFAARGLRHPPTARAAGFALIVGALLVGCFVLVVYVKYRGFTLPTYKGAREFKAIAQAGNVPLNTVPFTAVLSYLMGLCLIRPTRFLIATGFVLFVVSSVFTGSRAPFVILGASIFVFCACLGLRSRNLLLRSGTVVALIVTALLAIATIVKTSDATLFHLSEGRTHLWRVGLQKFTERPLFGFGYESWRDDLISRLPGDHPIAFELAERLGGGYHNEYISVLAEEGLIGAAVAASICWLLLRSSWLLGFRQWSAVHVGKWALFTAIFLLLRANFEVPGLFGYGQDPVDYLAYLFVAILVARISTEEDYARLVALPRVGSAA